MYMKYAYLVKFLNIYKYTEGDFMEYAKDNTYNLVLKKKKSINKKRTFLEIIICLTIILSIVNFILIYNFYKVLLLL